MELSDNARYGATVKPFTCVAYAWTFTIFCDSSASNPIQSKLMELEYKVHWGIQLHSMRQLNHRNQI